MNRKAASIMLAAGGTGGHIFPAQSLAEMLVARGCTVTLITDKRYSGYKQDEGNVFHSARVEIINSASMSGTAVQKIRAVFSNLSGYLAAKKIIAEVQPSVVVGFGGYPSFPTMLAASRAGIPTVVHEQNALLGKTNRVLAPKIDIIATSFTNTGLVDDAHKSKLRYVGNPVRHAIQTLRDVPYPSIDEGLPIRILVTGGSQGAQIFGEVIPKAIAMLPEYLKQRLTVDQQVRAEQLNDISQIYNQNNINAGLATFFANMRERIEAAHLVIARAGASTIAELTCAGRPAILVPLPSAADGHQQINAEAMEYASGAWIIPQHQFTAENIAAKLKSLLENHHQLITAAAAARKIGAPEAASNLADVVLKVAKT
jgi:UDP-N-acetylglucosamine--N-acetylmuramyl-(pentapeptide) pyrophosphoryl-undecaprenol N-acetylglucosamine transferase